MKHCIFILLFFLFWIKPTIAQNADPAVTEGKYTPATIALDTESILTFGFANFGTSAIPPESIELTISTVHNYYTTDGKYAPSGSAGTSFRWTYLGADTWRGTNITAIPPTSGGEVVVYVNSVKASSTSMTTIINVQPVANFKSFSNDASNDNLQVGLTVVGE